MTLASRIAVPRVLLVAVAASCAGCVSVIEAERFTGTQPGLRYSLPRPYVLVTPRQDGGIDVQPIMLPDSDSEYVVRSWTFLATHKFDLTFERGLLTSLGSVQDSAQVAAKLAENAAAVSKARIEAQATAAKEAAGSQAEAQEALSTALLELRQAREELKVLEAAVPPADPKAILEARVKVARAQAKHASLSESGSAASNRAARSAAGNMVQKGAAWGPMLYAVIQSPDGRSVELRAVEPQRMFGTVTVPKADAVANEQANAAVIKYSLKTQSPVAPGPDGRFTVQIATDTKVSRIVADRMRLGNVQSGIVYASPQHFAAELIDDGRIIELQINKSVPSGFYQISPAAITGSNDTQPAVGETLKFELRR